MNDRFLKRAYMYLSKMVLHVFLCKLVPEKRKKWEISTVFSEITLFLSNFIENLKNV